MRPKDAYVGMKCITDYGDFGGKILDCVHMWQNGHTVVVNRVCNNYIQCDCLTCGAKGYRHNAEYLRPLPYDDDCEIVCESGDILI